MNLIGSAHFDIIMNSTVAKALTNFSNVAQNYLGNGKADNYQEMVVELLSSFSKEHQNALLKWSHRRISLKRG